MIQNKLDCKKLRFVVVVVVDYVFLATLLLLMTLMLTRLSLLRQGNIHWSLDQKFENVYSSA